MATADSPVRRALGLRVAVGINVGREPKEESELAILECWQPHILSPVCSFGCNMAVLRSCVSNVFAIATAPHWDRRGLLGSIGTWIR